jgi:formiminoglutamase
MMHDKLKSYSKADILKYVSKRDGETKIGEVIRSEPELLGSDRVDYVLLGIPEDIGVRGNLGKGGAYSAWDAFLNAFLNVQSNQFLKGDNVLLLGHIDFESELKSLQALSTSRPDDVEVFRSETAKIDDVVSSIIQEIVEHGKIPIVIGGGHNNAYPIIKGVSKALNKPIGSINCDPHSDFRKLEGRHSGNGFSYAMENGFLKKYAVIGLHEGYNSETNIAALRENENIYTSYFEDIFIRGKLSWNETIFNAVSFIGELETGIELDLDSIERMPVSAFTPCGISIINARQYISRVRTASNYKYLHICEGAPLQNDINQKVTGKNISYLVSDFLKL